jgi:2'-5' RNA ligase
LTIDIIDPLSTKLEQQTRIEKISLVAFLDKEQKKSFANVNRRIKKNNMNYYQNSNLHVTLFGFGPLEKIHNEKIQERLRTFFKNSRTKGLMISLDTIRPGAFYSKNRFSPTNGMGNGTVIAFGNVDTNRFFF